MKTCGMIWNGQMMSTLNDLQLILLIYTCRIKKIITWAIKTHIQLILDFTKVQKYQYIIYTMQTM